MNSKLAYEIKQIQCGDQQSMLKLLDQFAPLLKKYAYMLHQEDAILELQCVFLETIKKMNMSGMESSSDGAITNYICKTIYHNYIMLGKKKSQEGKNLHIDEKDEFDPFQYDIRYSTKDEYVAVLCADLKSVLNTQEYQIIYAIYVQQYQVSEIAGCVGKSRQAINQTKKRALKKLKEYWGSPMVK